MDEQQPIIVVKKKQAHGGHHGGAWKVAYADFVTAMMAFFLVMWLVSQGDPVKEAVAGYFTDPVAFAAAGASLSPEATPVTVSQDGDGIQAELASAAERIRRAIGDLYGSGVSDQIEVTVAQGGLRVEMIESRETSFFTSGSANLKDSSEALLEIIAHELRDLGHGVVLEGHTDGHPFPSDTYSNWELSVDRANAARRVMEEKGLERGQIKGVFGYADTRLRFDADPFDARNRRISIQVDADGGPP